MRTLAIVLGLCLSIGVHAEEVRTAQKLADGSWSVSQSVTVLGTAKRVELVYVQPSHERAARELLDRAALYIPAVATLLGTQPPIDVYRIVDLDDGTTEKARNEGTQAYVPFVLKTTGSTLGPALLYHEIGHWWFPYNPRWVQEGIVSFLPFVVGEEGQLPLSKTDAMQVQNWWGLYRPLPKQDRPLDDAPHPEWTGDLSFALHYEKSFKIQYLVRSILGRADYLKFLKTLIGERSRPNPPWVAYNAEVYDRATEGVLRALEQIKPLDWKNHLSGWVATAQYQTNSPAVFADPDRDGLLTVQENAMGTNPAVFDTDADSFGDGTEVELGTSPLLSTSAGQIERLVRLHGPVLDGIDDEWRVLSAARASSPSTPGVDPRYDFLSFEWTVVDDVLYALVKTRRPMAPREEDEGLYFFIVDATEPKVHDGWGFWFSQTATDGWDYARTAAASAPIVGRVRDVFEFSVPVREWRGKTVKWIVILRPNAQGGNVSFWDRYVAIEIPIPDRPSAETK